MGQCAKGFKCKYSHDLAVERKTRKIDLFSDMRSGEGEGDEEEGMDDWDQGEFFFFPRVFSYSLLFLLFSPEQRLRCPSLVSFFPPLPSSPSKSLSFSFSLSHTQKTPGISPEKTNKQKTTKKSKTEKLESVVKQKHGADAGNSSTAQANNRTNIICKHFLDAVEKRQYGWFWQCPNGNKECKYR